MMTPWRVIVALVALLRAADAATSCPKALDRDVPTVVTLFAAPDDPANAAWVLKPDCSLEVIKIAPAPDNGVPMLNSSSRGIQRVESIPSKAELVQLWENPLTEVDLSSGTKLYQLVLAWDNLKSVDTFKFPELLGIIDFDGNNLQGFAKGAIPAKVNTVYLNRNKITSLANFALPTFLTSLHLEKNNFTTLGFAIPAGLVDLHMDSNTQLATIENVTMPNTLTTFTCTDCAIETFRGVQLSANLATLDLTGSTLTEFEIRQSDLAIFRQLKFAGSVAQTKCSHPNATLIRATGVSVCVISDAAFDEEYLGILPSSGSTTSGGSSNAASTPTSLAPTPSPTVPASSSSTTTVIIIVAVVCVVCAIIGFFFFRKRSRKKGLGKAGKGDEYQDATTVEAGGSSAAATAQSGSTNASASSEYLTNDIRNDEALIAMRIAYEDIQILRVIGKGGFGVVHLGKFRGRKVAVKQMLPDKAKDMRVVRSFMDEIRLYASLEHPRIVAFIGLRWSTLQDIAVINEYMAGGDLHSVLRKQQTFDPADWFEASAALKPKSALALDVIVALVYLHSFEQPIIHRDLKTRNVLLNSEGDAKLSDFGTSREALLDETMTGEIGTLAWIAPEVLRGERYSEKADIYSLGVLLVELDTASHPYRNALAENNHGGSPISNTRIALMVSAGRLAPSTSPGCPSDITALIMSCLSYDQHVRPSAMEIHYQLRQILRSRTG